MDKVSEQDPNLVETLSFQKLGESPQIFIQINNGTQKSLWSCHCLMVPLPLSLFFKKIFSFLISPSLLQVEQEVNRLGRNSGGSSGSSRYMGRHHGGGGGVGGQWKPALQGIAEIGS